MLLIIFSYFEWHISNIVIDYISEKEAEIYINALIKEISKSINFIVSMRIQIEKLLSNYI